jgi:hypothetical protein
MESGSLGSAKFYPEKPEKKLWGNCNKKDNNKKFDN